ncbi:hypothetical protein IWW38_005439, partial [Coemansia aciculifera]
MSYARLESAPSPLPLHSSDDSVGGSQEELSYCLGNKSDGGDSSKLRGMSAATALLSQVPKSVVLCVLLAIWTVSYLLALQAGDLLFINEHLGVIGAELLVSVGALTVATVMLYSNRRLRSKVRRGAILSILAIFGILYWYDHGERFEKHGFYNLLVFLAIFIPLNTAIGVFYVLWMKIDNFVVYFGVALGISGIGGIASL